ncbi:hypothetical protein [Hymenobacter bucti]|uniref:Uncharacterized protein n=1 Tax=Hymenobacter bucti TaxID=1844114 RepID=A0ABW4QUP9_9BACT
MMLLFLLAPLPHLLPLLAPPTPAQLVVPGRSMGNLKLGADAATLATLGPAAYSDAAMQKAWATWFGTGHPPAQLDVYTTMIPGQDTHKAVQVVRATSAYFRLANGLRTGATLSQIQASYGRLPLAISYRLQAGPRYLYDDVRRGIAFELDGQASTSHCRALVVHQLGQPVAKTYLSMPVYLKEVPVRN